MFASRIRGAIVRYSRDQRGVSTVWSIFWSIVFLVTSGFVIDASYAYRTRIALQATADSAAIAAVMAYREREYYETFTGQATYDRAARAKSVADIIAQQIMGPSNGDVLVPENIILGHWDGESFSEGASPGMAINSAKITTLRTTENGNNLPTLLLGAFGGFNSWDVGATAIAESYLPQCFQKQGVFAVGGVDLQTQTEIIDYTCLHGEEFVDMQTGNVFGGNTIVSAPTDQQLTGTGTMEDIFAANDGLEDVWTNETLIPKIIQDFDRIVQTVAYPDYAHPEDIEDFLPDYVQPDAISGRYDDNTVQYLSAAEFEAVMFEKVSGTLVEQPLLPGSIHLVPCADPNQIIELNKEQKMEEVVFVTNCRLQFGQKMYVSNSMVVSLNPMGSTTEGVTSSEWAISGSADTGFGSGDCNTENGTIVMAEGDIRFAAKLGLMKTQMISKYDIHIAANYDGLNGSYIVAGGDVKVAALGAVGNCWDYVPDNRISEPYYRLVY